jgi:hypothetical protein
MSRSRKKPYVRDKGMSTQEYWGSIRRVWKQQMRGVKFWDEDFNFKHPKEIHNDYNFCDWSWFIQESRPYWGEEEPRHWFGHTKEDVKKYSRK